MTTKVTITAETHGQNKLVHVDTVHGGVASVNHAVLKTGESTEVYVYEGQTVVITEAEIPTE